MAGNARAGDRDGDLEGAAPAGGAAVGAPHVTTTSDAPPRAAHRDAAPHDGRTASREHQDRAAPHEDHDRAAPHEAQQTEGGAETAPPLGRNPEVEESALPPHEPGSMDIAYHEETYHRFIRIVIRAVIVVFVVLVLLALVNG